MVGFESKWALTREAMMLPLGVVDEASTRVLGLEGRRPRRPLRLSVRTTKRGTERRRGTLKAHVCDSHMAVTAPHNLKNNCCISFSFPFPAAGAMRFWLHTVSLSLPASVSQDCHYKPLVSCRHSLVTESFKRVWHCITFFDHSHCKTFLETAELAAVSPPLVHWTVFIGEAHILCIFLYGSLSNREKNTLL